MFSKLQGSTGGMNLRGGKIDRKKILLIVALGAVIVGAIVISVVQFLKDGASALDNVSTVLHFRCESCGYEFLVDPEKEAAIAKEADMSNQPRPQDCGLPADFPRTCPSCNAPGKARKQNQCPSCKAWYLPEAPPTPFMMPSPNENRPNEICPNCHIDIPAWRAKHAK